MTMTPWGFCPSGSAVDHATAPVDALTAVRLAPPPTVVSMDSRLPFHASARYDSGDATAGMENTTLPSALRRADSWAQLQYTTPLTYSGVCWRHTDALPPSLYFHLSVPVAP